MKEYDNTEYVKFMSEKFGISVPEDKYRVPDPSFEKSYDEFRKYADMSEPEYDPVVLNAAIEYVFRMMRPAVGAGGERMSYTQIVRGMNLATSPGAFDNMVGGKFHTKGVVLTEADPPHPERLAHFSASVFAAASGTGVAWPAPYCNTSKEEVRGFGRNPRGFASGPLDLYCMKMSFLGDLFSKFIAANTGKVKGLKPGWSWYFPGCNHYGGAWRALSEDLKKMAGKLGIIYSYDFSGWDRSVKNVWVNAAVNVCFKLLGKESHTAFTYATLQQLTYMMTNGLVIMEDGVVYRTDYGVKSGDVMTTPINTIAHMIVIATAVLGLARKQGVSMEDATVAMSRGFTARMAGDDGIGAFNPAIVWWLTHADFTAELKRLCFTFKKLAWVTPEQFQNPKTDAEMVDFVSKFFIASRGVVCGAPDREKFRCKFRYGSHTLDRRIGLVRLLSYRRDAWPDPVLFNEFDQYAKYYVEKHAAELQNDKAEDVITWADCMHQWDRECDLEYLHTGFESEAESVKPSVRWAQHDVSDIESGIYVLGTDLKKSSADNGSTKEESIFLWKEEEKFSSVEGRESGPVPESGPVKESAAYEVARQAEETAEKAYNQKMGHARD